MTQLDFPSQKMSLIQPVYNDGKIIAIEISPGKMGMKNVQGPYAHPQNCFFKTEESVELPISDFDDGTIRVIATQYLKATGFAGFFRYDRERKIPTEEPNHIEIFMDTGARIASPEIAYTKSIGTCMGLSMYQPCTKQGALYHIGGSDSKSIDKFCEAVTREVNRLGQGIQAHFVSGLATIDEESLIEIMNSRIEGLRKLDSYPDKITSIEPIFCNAVGEYIALFSLDSNTGKIAIEKKQLSHEELNRVDILLQAVFRK